MSNLIYDPGFIKRRSSPAGGTIGQHTLSEEEYDAFLLLMPYAGQDPVTETDGKIVTMVSGEIVYAKR